MLQTVTGVAGGQSNWVKSRVQIKTSNSKKTTHPFCGRIVLPTAVKPLLLGRREYQESKRHP